jgi:hypothetical protein
MRRIRRFFRSFFRRLKWFKVTTDRAYFRLSEAEQDALRDFINDGTL